MPDSENPTQFDPDYSPENPHNQAAAANQGLRFDPERQAYVDSDGCLIRDQYGQEF